MATHKLKNPPIIEFACAFRFDLENLNDATLPGRLYDVVKEKFPIIKSRNIGTIHPIEGKANNAEFLISSLAQFYNKEENLLLQVGYNLLTVNCIKKYPTWEKYKPVITENYNKFCELANPKGIHKISLKSINKIHIPGDNIDLNDYFTLYPNIPKNITEPLNSFNLLIQTTMKNKRDILVMRNFTVPDKEKDNHAAFVLDLSYIMNQTGGITLEEVDEWLEVAHTELYNAFIASIKPNLLAYFEK